MKRYLSVLAAVAALAALPVYAQNTVTFNVTVAQSGLNVTPTLTWATNPPAPGATPCTASGSSTWTGAKAPSGSQTLAAITTSTTYSLSCTWPGDSIATFTWVNPTENTDNSPYTNPQLVRLIYSFGATPTVVSQCGVSGVVCVDVSQTPTLATMRTVTGITQTGALQVVARACNTQGICSDVSPSATKFFTGNVVVARSVDVKFPKGVSGLALE